MTFSPFPNPYSPPIVKFNGNKLIINKAIVLNRNERGKIQPRIIINLKDKEVVMQSGDGLVELNLSKNSDNKLSENKFFVSLGIGKGSIFGS